MNEYLNTDHEHWTREDWAIDSIVSVLLEHGQITIRHPHCLHTETFHVMDMYQYADNAGLDDDAIEQLVFMTVCDAKNDTDNALQSSNDIIRACATYFFKEIENEFVESYLKQEAA